jgi:thymidylate kinase
MNAIFPAPAAVLFFEITPARAIERRPGDEELLRAVESVYREIAAGNRYITLDANQPHERLCEDAKREIVEALRTIGVPRT